MGKLNYIFFMLCCITFFSSGEMNLVQNLQGKDLKPIHPMEIINSEPRDPLDPSKPNQLDDLLYQIQIPQKITK